MPSKLVFSSTAVKLWSRFVCIYVRFYDENAATFEFTVGLRGFKEPTLQAGK